MSTPTEQLSSTPINNAESSQSGKIGKKNFRQSEDIKLVNSYIRISEDGDRGNNQDGAAFWRSIADIFNMGNGPDDVRDCGSLKNRWGIINRKVSKYVGCLDTASIQLGSGYVPKDKIALAKQLYRKRIVELENGKTVTAPTKKGKETVGENFTLEHCYEIMVKHPKWYPREMKQNESEDLVVYSNHQAPEGSGSSSTDDAAHPARPENGRRKLKEDKRVEKRNMDSFLERFGHYLDGKMKAEAEAEAVKKRKTAMKAKQVRRFFDMKMLSISTSGETDPYILRTLRKHKKDACDRLNKESIADITGDVEEEEETLVEEEGESEDEEQQPTVEEAESEEREIVVLGEDPEVVVLEDDAKVVDLEENDDDNEL